LIYRQIQSLSRAQKMEIRTYAQILDLIFHVAILSQIPLVALKLQEILNVSWFLVCLPLELAMVICAVLAFMLTRVLAKFFALTMVILIAMGWFATIFLLLRKADGDLTHYSYLTAFTPLFGSQSLMFAGWAWRMWRSPKQTLASVAMDRLN